MIWTGYPSPFRDSFGQYKDTYTCQYPAVQRLWCEVPTSDRDLWTPDIGGPDGEGTGSKLGWLALMSICNPKHLAKARLSRPEPVAS